MHIKCGGQSLVSVEKFRFAKKRRIYRKLYCIIFNGKVLQNPAMTCCDE